MRESLSVRGLVYASLRLFKQFTQQTATYLRQTCFDESSCVDRRNRDALVGFVLLLVSTLVSVETNSCPSVVTVVTTCSNTNVTTCHKQFFLQLNTRGQ